MKKSPRNEGKVKMLYSEIGREISGHYSAADLDADAEARIGVPGEFPFTRHIHASGNRVRPWAPSLYSGFGSAEDTNRRFRFLIDAGNGRANVAADLPTQIGLDSDDPLASGEVGRLGVAIDSLEDFETMFEGVRLVAVKNEEQQASAAVFRARDLLVRNASAKKMRRTSDSGD